jgi:hypothetical protein
MRSSSFDTDNAALAGHAFFFAAALVVIYMHMSICVVVLLVVCTLSLGSRPSYAMTHYTPTLNPKS